MPTKTVTRHTKSGPLATDITSSEITIDFGIYNVSNPLPARRVIYDGIENDRPMVIEPGETLKGIRLADILVKEFQARKGDLVVTPADREEMKLGD